MSLSVAFNNALTGLYTNQQALGVTSHNIANVNTEGYSKQNVQLSSQYFDGEIGGVRMEGIVRQVDTFLQTSVRRQYGTVGERAAINEYMDRIQIRLGEPGQTNSLDEYTEDFLNAIQSLAETPERISFQENAYFTASTLAREVSDMAGDLEFLRLQADQEINESVNDINNKLQALFNLNISINQSNALGAPSASLLDDRDLLLEELSEEMNISTFFQESGEVSIFTGQGIPLLDVGLYQLEYNNVNDVNFFIEDVPLGELNVLPYNPDGTVRLDGIERTLISGGVEGDVSTVLTGGRLKGLHETRDQVIPDILAQLDEFSAVMRDEFNAIHNLGSSYPGTSELNGSRAVFGNNRNQWEGSFRLAVLDSEGLPVNSTYNDESYTGFRPLELDLSTLDGGFGAGNPDIQTIIDEINNHYSASPIKTTVGNFNNIQMTSAINAMPDAPAKFVFDFDIENISGFDADLFLSDITVLDDTGADITAFNTAPTSLSLNPVNTYTTTAGQPEVEVAILNNNLQVGDRIYLNEPGVPVNGIPSASLTGYFEVKAVTSGGILIDLAAGSATGTGSVNVAGIEAVVKQDTIETGEKRRTDSNARIDLDLTGNAGSSYYDISVNVGVDDKQGGTGDIETSTITYRIYNFQTNMLNDRFDSSAATVDGVRSAPSNNSAYLTAMLVDADGMEIPRDNNGDYIKTREGTLVLKTNNDEHNIVIQDLGTAERGQTITNPEAVGTGRNFSHYFGLNNFFESNTSSDTGEEKTGSAYNFAVEDRFDSNASLISLGSLATTNQPADPNSPPLYTYERYIGDNSIGQQLAELSTNQTSFSNAGGLDSSVQTFNGYLAEVIAFNSARANNVEQLTEDASIILNGYIERSDTFKGVNIDEELANTIIFQNAYTASARVITTAGEMFETLLNAF